STLAAVCYTVFYFFYYAADPDLHSFPTRRSSDLGDAMPPSVEAVAARRPDLVVLYRAGPNLTAAEQLERLGIRTVLLDLNLLERSEEHTSELQSLRHLVCRLLLEKKKSYRKTREN